MDNTLLEFMHEKFKLYEKQHSNLVPIKYNPPASKLTSLIQYLN